MSFEDLFSEAYTPELIKAKILRWRKLLGKLYIFKGKDKDVGPGKTLDIINVKGKGIVFFFFFTADSDKFYVRFRIDGEFIDLFDIATHKEAGIDHYNKYLWLSKIEPTAPLYGMTCIIPLPYEKEIRIDLINGDTTSHTIKAYEVIGRKLE